MSMKSRSESMENNWPTKNDFSNEGPAGALVKSEADAKLRKTADFFGGVDRGG